MNGLIMRLLALLATLCFFCPSFATADEPVARKHLSSNFEETREAVKTAIENRGLVINYVSHIADMLNRTGTDLGTSRKIFEQGEILEFCSASLSRKMMEADPHNIVLCPFALSIYTLPGENGTWLAYRKPHGQAAAIVEPMLQGIVSEASE